MSPTVREQVLSVLGTGGDEVVMDYVVMCLEDQDFHLGPNGEEALDAFGPVLVSAESGLDAEARGPWQASLPCPRCSLRYQRRAARRADGRAAGPVCCCAP